MMIRIRRFTAWDDDGRRYAVVIHPRAGCGDEVEQLTADGEPVERLDGGRYRIVDSGVVLTADAP
jgi:hypothetical protein